jgi:hypothetical protein
MGMKLQSFQITTTYIPLYISDSNPLKNYLKWSVENNLKVHPQGELESQVDIFGYSK